MLLCKDIYNKEDEEKNAYPEDECSYGDCWQMTDFMQKLGFKYPETNI